LATHDQDLARHRTLRRPRAKAKAKAKVKAAAIDVAVAAAAEVVKEALKGRSRRSAPKPHSALRHTGRGVRAGSGR